MEIIIYGRLTQQKLLEILKTIYFMDQNNEDLKVIDIINDIKQQVLMVINEG